MIKLFEDIHKLNKEQFDEFIVKCKFFSIDHFRKYQDFPSAFLYSICLKDCRAHIGMNEVCKCECLCENCDDSIKLNEALELIKKHGVVVKKGDDSDQSPQYTDETWIKDTMEERYISRDVCKQPGLREEGPDLIPIGDSFFIIQDTVVTSTPT